MVQDCDYVAGNYFSLFVGTIRKLEDSDIPSCLWIFLASSDLADDMRNPTVGQM